jgi:N6-adenosine-specific RNA methylase IME4
MIDMRDLPNAGHYGMILADCPWEFETYSGPRVPQRAAEQHYPTMSLDELKALPVRAVAGPHCLLHMWILQTHLPQALDLGAHWGFAFKTLGLIWHKMTPAGMRPMGLGHWFRTEGEISLLFTRGKPKRLDRGLRQFINAPIREHSRKPEDQYRRLECLVAGPRLEMFARQQRDGWDAWGNETTKFGASARRDDTPLFGSAAE